MGGTTTETFRITIVNKNPVYTNSDPKKVWCVYMNRPFDLDLEEFFTDPDGHDMTVTASIIPKLGISWVAPSYLVGSGNGQDGANNTITMTATDGYGGSATGTIVMKWTK